MDAIPIIMTALTKLSASYSINLPFQPERIQMPSLQILFPDVNDLDTLSACLPDFLNTLVIHTAEEGDYVGKVLHVENLCLIPSDYWDGLPSCIDTINTFIVPSSIKHLEVVLYKYIRSRELNIDLLDTFEEFLLNLHDTGSFGRLTLTFPEDAMDPQAYDHVFPRLKSLGLLDEIRVAPSPICLASVQR
ncbi:hypothetical protein EYR40_005997 [Pleurotus pulmonarius]|nr:hypothetical protein EYR36_005619 [Pleurotus pulmonarius]KAF4602780.1 hypothetical protein EYR40_005997 [Pleurotus pulmonarius]